jgi:hypothetical protein
VVADDAVDWRDAGGMPAAQPDFWWLSFGGHAFGLAQGSRVIAVLYWTAAEVAEIDGEPAVRGAGFFLVEVDATERRLHVLDGADDSEHWLQAFAAAGRLVVRRRGLRRN